MAATRRPVRSLTVAVLIRRPTDRRPTDQRHVIGATLIGDTRIGALRIGAAPGRRNEAVTALVGTAANRSRRQSEPRA